jgi:hydrogenase/urease accessory protein HupE
MAFKWAAAVVAVLLLGAYLLALAIKLKQIDLGIVIAVGLGLMLVDLWQSLRSKED